MGCHGWLVQPCIRHCWTSQQWHPTRHFTCVGLPVTFAVFDSLIVRAGLTDLPAQMPLAATAKGRLGLAGTITFLVSSWRRQRERSIPADEIVTARSSPPRGHRRHDHGVLGPPGGRCGGCVWFRPVDRESRSSLHAGAGAARSPPADQHPTGQGGENQARQGGNPQGGGLFPEPRDRKTTPLGGPRVLCNRIELLSIGVFVRLTRWAVP